MNEQRRTYIIQQGEQSEQVRGREAAVTTARRWSAARVRPVQLKRADQKMHMVFRKGALENFVLELN